MEGITRYFETNRDKAMFHLHLLSSIREVVSVTSRGCGVGGGVWYGLVTFHRHLCPCVQLFLAAPSRLHPLARPLLSAEAFWNCRRTTQLHSVFFLAESGQLFIFAK